MTKHLLPVLCLAVLAAVAAVHVRADPNNPNIDMPGFLRVANQAAGYRATRRVSEDDFIRLSQEPGTIILDARSKQKFDLLHVKGALNLDFSDIDVESLRKNLPDKNARILIYCNNNFGGDRSAFPLKAAPASLNLSTYITLYQYGYRNVFELEPSINVKTTRLTLVPSYGAAQAASTLAPATPPLPAALPVIR